MNRIKQIHIKSPRRAALLVLGWLHCGLIAGIAFSAFFDLISTLGGIELMGPEESFFRGVLFAVPTGLCRLAIKRLRALWQFFLAAIGLCALSWLITGHPGGAVLMALMCVIRVRSRLAEEEEGPVNSLFDHPSYLGLCLFATAFLMSAGIADGLPRLQWLSILGAVLYMLVCLGYSGLDRLDSYLLLNKDMYGLPAKRIQHIAGSALLASVLLAAALLLPMAISNSGFVQLKMPEFNNTGAAEPEIDVSQSSAAGPATMDMSGLIDEEDRWQIPPIVGQILMGLIGAGLLAGIVLAVIQLFKDFRRSYTDSRDLVQYIGRDELQRAEETVETLRKPRVWDRSVTATIRRRYRKTLLKAGNPPEGWMSPEEAEKAAGVDIPALHRVYEKARYGPAECTQEDLKELR